MSFSDVVFFILVGTLVHLYLVGLIVSFQRNTPSILIGELTRSLAVDSIRWEQCTIEQITQLSLSFTVSDYQVSFTCDSLSTSLSFVRIVTFILSIIFPRFFNTSVDIHLNKPNVRMTKTKSSSRTHTNEGTRLSTAFSSSSSHSTNSFFTAIDATFFYPIVQRIFRYLTSSKKTTPQSLQALLSRFKVYVHQSTVLSVDGEAGTRNWVGVTVDEASFGSVVLDAASKSEVERRSDDLIDEEEAQIKIGFDASNIVLIAGAEEVDIAASPNNSDSLDLSTRIRRTELRATVETVQMRGIASTVRKDDKTRLMISAVEIAVAYVHGSTRSVTLSLQDALSKDPADLFEISTNSDELEENDEDFSENEDEITLEDVFSKKDPSFWVSHMLFQLILPSKKRKRKADSFLVGDPLFDSDCEIKAEMMNETLTSLESDLGTVLADSSATIVISQFIYLVPSDTSFERSQVASRFSRSLPTYNKQPARPIVFDKYCPVDPYVSKFLVLEGMMDNRSETDIDESPTTSWITELVRTFSEGSVYRSGVVFDTLELRLNRSEDRSSITLSATPITLQVHPSQISQFEDSLEALFNPLANYHSSFPSFTGPIASHCSLAAVLLTIFEKDGSDVIESKSCECGVVVQEISLRFSSLPTELLAQSPQSSPSQIDQSTITRTLSLNTDAATVWTEHADAVHKFSSHPFIGVGSDTSDIILVGGISGTAVQTIKRVEIGSDGPAQEVSHSRSSVTSSLMFVQNVIEGELKGPVRLSVTKGTQHTADVLLSLSSSVCSSAKQLFDHSISHSPLSSLAKPTKTVSTSLRVSTPAVHALVPHTTTSSTATLIALPPSTVVTSNRAILDEQSSGRTKRTKKLTSGNEFVVIGEIARMIETTAVFNGIISARIVSVDDHEEDETEKDNQRLLFSLSALSFQTGLMTSNNHFVPIPASIQQTSRTAKVLIGELSIPLTRRKFTSFEHALSRISKLIPSSPSSNINTRNTTLTLNIDSIDALFPLSKTSNFRIAGKEVGLSFLPSLDRSSPPLYSFSMVNLDTSINTTPLFISAKLSLTNSTSLLTHRIELEPLPEQSEHFVSASFLTTSSSLASTLTPTLSSLPSWSIAHQDVQLSWRESAPRQGLVSTDLFGQIRTNPATPYDQLLPPPVRHSVNERRYVLTPTFIQVAEEEVEVQASSPMESLELSPDEPQQGGLVGLSMMDPSLSTPQLKIRKRVINTHLLFSIDERNEDGEFLSELLRVGRTQRNSAFEDEIDALQKAELRRELEREREWQEENKFDGEREKERQIELQANQTLEELWKRDREEEEKREEEWARVEEEERLREEESNRMFDETMKLALLLETGLSTSEDVQTIQFSKASLQTLEQLKEANRIEREKEQNEFQVRLNRRKEERALFQKKQEAFKKQQENHKRRIQLKREHAKNERARREEQKKDEARLLALVEMWKGGIKEQRTIDLCGEDESEEATLTLKGKKRDKKVTLYTKTAQKKIADAEDELSLLQSENLDTPARVSTITAELLSRWNRAMPPSQYQQSRLFVHSTDFTELREKQAEIVGTYFYCLKFASAASTDADFNAAHFMSRVKHKSAPFPTALTTENFPVVDLEEASLFIHTDLDIDVEIDDVYRGLDILSIGLGFDMSETSSPSIVSDTVAVNISNSSVYLMETIADSVGRRTRIAIDVATSVLEHALDKQGEQVSDAQVKTPFKKIRKVIKTAERESFDFGAQCQTVPVLAVSFESLNLLLTEHDMKPVKCGSLVLNSSDVVVATHCLPKTQLLESQSVSFAALIFPSIEPVEVFGEVVKKPNLWDADCLQIVSMSVALHNPRLLIHPDTYQKITMISNAIQKVSTALQQINLKNNDSPFVSEHCFFDVSATNLFLSLVPGKSRTLLTNRLLKESEDLPFSSHVIFEARSLALKKLGTLFESNCESMTVSVGRGSVDCEARLSASTISVPILSVTHSLVDGKPFLDVSFLPPQSTVMHSTESRMALPSFELTLTATSVIAHTISDHVLILRSLRSQKETKKTPESSLRVRLIDLCGSFVSAEQYMNGILQQDSGIPDLFLRIKEEEAIHPSRLAINIPFIEVVVVQSATTTLTVELFELSFAASDPSPVARTTRSQSPLYSPIKTRSTLINNKLLKSNNHLIDVTSLLLNNDRIKQTLNEEREEADSDQEEGHVARPFDEFDDDYTSYNNEVLADRYTYVLRMRIQERNKTASANWEKEQSFQNLVKRVKRANIPSERSIPDYDSAFYSRSVQASFVYRGIVGLEEDVTISTVNHIRFMMTVEEETPFIEASFNSPRISLTHSHLESLLVVSSALTMIGHSAINLKRSPTEKTADVSVLNLVRTTQTPQFRVSINNTLSVSLCEMNPFSTIVFTTPSVSVVSTKVGKTQDLTNVEVGRRFVVETAPSIRVCFIREDVLAKYSFSSMPVLLSDSTLSVSYLKLNPHLTAYSQPTNTIQLRLPDFSFNSIPSSTFGPLVTFVSKASEAVNNHYAAASQAILRSLLPLPAFALPKHLSRFVDMASFIATIKIPDITSTSTYSLNELRARFGKSIELEVLKNAVYAVEEMPFANDVYNTIESLWVPGREKVEDSLVAEAVVDAIDMHRHIKSFVASQDLLKSFSSVLTEQDEEQSKEGGESEEAAESSGAGGDGEDDKNEGVDASAPRYVISLVTDEIRIVKISSEYTTTHTDEDRMYTSGLVRGVAFTTSTTPGLASVSSLKINEIDVRQTPYSQLERFLDVEDSGETSEVKDRIGQIILGRTSERLTKRERKLHESDREIFRKAQFSLMPSSKDTRDVPHLLFRFFFPPPAVSQLNHSLNITSVINSTLLTITKDPERYAYQVGEPQPSLDFSPTVPAVTLAVIRPNVTIAASMTKSLQIYEAIDISLNSVDLTIPPNAPSLPDLVRKTIHPEKRARRDMLKQRLRSYMSQSRSIDNSPHVTPKGTPRTNKRAMKETNMETPVEAGMQVITLSFDSSAPTSALSSPTLLIPRHLTTSCPHSGMRSPFIGTPAMVFSPFLSRSGASPQSRAHTPFLVKNAFDDEESEDVEVDEDNLFAEYLNLPSDDDEAETFSDNTPNDPRIKTLQNSIYKETRKLRNEELSFYSRVSADFDNVTFTTMEETNTHTRTLFSDTVDVKFPIDRVALDVKPSRFTFSDFAVSPSQLAFLIQSEFKDLSTMASKQYKKRNNIRSTRKATIKDSDYMRPVFLPQPKLSGTAIGTSEFTHSFNTIFEEQDRRINEQFRKAMNPPRSSSPVPAKVRMVVAPPVPRSDDEEEDGLSAMERMLRRVERMSEEERGWSEEDEDERERGKSGSLDGQTSEGQSTHTDSLDHPTSSSLLESSTTLSKSTELDEMSAIQSKTLSSIKQRRFRSFTERIHEICSSLAAELDVESDEANLKPTDEVSGRIGPVQEQSIDGDSPESGTPEPPAVSFEDRKDEENGEVEEEEGEKKENDVEEPVEDDDISLDLDDFDVEDASDPAEHEDDKEETKPEQEQPPTPSGLDTRTAASPSPEEVPAEKDTKETGHTQNEDDEDEEFNFSGSDFEAEEDQREDDKPITTEEHVEQEEKPITEEDQPEDDKPATEEEVIEPKEEPTTEEQVEQEEKPITEEDQPESEKPEVEEEKEQEERPITEEEHPEDDKPITPEEDVDQEEKPTFEEEEKLEEEPTPSDDAKEPDHHQPETEPSSTEPSPPEQEDIEPSPPEPEDIEPSPPEPEDIEPSPPEPEDNDPSPSPPTDDEIEHNEAEPPIPVADQPSPTPEQDDGNSVSLPDGTEGELEVEMEGDGEAEEVDVDTLLDEEGMDKGNEQNEPTHEESAQQNHVEDEAEVDVDDVVDDGVPPEEDEGEKEKTDEAKPSSTKKEKRKKKGSKKGKRKRKSKEQDHSVAGTDDFDDYFQ
ncbi:hypothetical protein BLNAU_5898 [Blattamonas nauphoetae]|uniref:Uncharacterized protein n=1 Tax=Blattamonas nauphoetae TaxID=2049346 RepID=A0ABQ9Y5U6_9EUKA|nr:hypothetical protein BLNAU_5898 [Blattamonas nauphoetae]